MGIRRCKDRKIQNDLYSDIIKLIEEAKLHVAYTANVTMTLLYWKIGYRINTDLLEGQRADYGKQIVSLLATQLQSTYGKRGFQERNIRRMMQFTELFPDFQIVSELATQLTWSHFIELFAIKKNLQREFYTQMATHEKWSMVIRQFSNNLLEKSRGDKMSPLYKR